MSKRALCPIPNELDCSDRSPEAQWLIQNVDVFLNGIKQKGVAYYNIEKGRLTYLKTAGYGNFKTTHRSLPSYGKIEVKYKYDVAND